MPQVCPRCGAAYVQQFMLTDTSTLLMCPSTTCAYPLAEPCGIGTFLVEKSPRMQQACGGTAMRDGNGDDDDDDTRRAMHVAVPSVTTWLGYGVRATRRCSVDGDGGGSAAEAAEYCEWTDNDCFVVYLRALATLPPATVLRAWTVAPPSGGSGSGSGSGEVVVKELTSSLWLHAAAYAVDGSKYNCTAAAAPPRGSDDVRALVHFYVDFLSQVYREGNEGEGKEVEVEEKGGEAVPADKQQQQQQRSAPSGGGGVSSALVWALPELCERSGVLSQLETLSRELAAAFCGVGGAADAGYTAGSGCGSGGGGVVFARLLEIGGGAPVLLLVLCDQGTWTVLDAMMRPASVVRRDETICAVVRLLNEAYADALPALLTEWAYDDLTAAAAPRTCVHCGSDGCCCGDQRDERRCFFVIASWFDVLFYHDWRARRSGTALDYGALRAELCGVREQAAAAAAAAAAAGADRRWARRLALRMVAFMRLAPVRADIGCVKYRPPRDSVAPPLRCRGSTATATLCGALFDAGPMPSSSLFDDDDNDSSSGSVGWASMAVENDDSAALGEGSGGGAASGLAAFVDAGVSMDGSPPPPPPLFVLSPADDNDDAGSVLLSSSSSSSSGDAEPAAVDDSSDDGVLAMLASMPPLPTLK